MTIGAYSRRVVDADLDELFAHLPAILLDGPRGVGKTATALQRARTVRRLDDELERAVVDVDPNVATVGPRPVLLDEWQRVPAVWDAVKRAVDRDSSGGQYLLTGSIPRPESRVHSGAGRITTMRMYPMTLPERGVVTPSVSLAALMAGERGVQGRCALTLSEYTDEILASGFPGVRRMEGRSLQAQLDSYLDRIVEHDMHEAGLSVRRPASVRAWLRAYAAATSTTASWETIRDAATAGSGQKPSRSATLPYIDTLTSLRVLDELPAWEPGFNHLNRLSKGAKHHLADPALAARLVGVERAQLLAGQQGEVEMPRDGSFLGALFESLATMSVRVFAQRVQARVAHLRTFDGRREVDLIVERGDGRVFAIEVKLSGAVEDRDVRHLEWLHQEIGDRLIGSAVITTGPETYRYNERIAVIPLGLLGP